MSNQKEKTTHQQYELLVNVMQEKPDIARNFTKRSPEAVAAFWNELTDQLNQLGSRKRDVSGWKKVWSDYKSYIKKKLAANKKEITGTGGGPCKQKSFTSLEEAVIALVNTNHGVDGIGALSFGSEEAGQENNEEPAMTNTPSTSWRRPRNALTSIQLLRKQVDEQRQFHDEIKNALQGTTNALKDTTTCLKRLYRSEEGILEVEKKN